MKLNYAYAFLPLALMLAGCAKVSEKKLFSELKQTASNDLMQDIAYFSPADIVQSAYDVDTELLRPVSRFQAVGMALRNNISLQTDFEELGVAAADLGQAGLYTNPHIDSFFRFPNTSGNVNIEVDLQVNLADLWLIPLKKKMAKKKKEQLLFKLLMQMVNVRNSVQDAYDECYFLQQFKALEKEKLALAQKRLQTIIHRQEYGYHAAVDVHNEDQHVRMHNVSLARINEQLKHAYIKLRFLLGAMPMCKEISINEDMTGIEKYYRSRVLTKEKFLQHALAFSPEVRQQMLRVAELEVACIYEGARVEQFNVGLNFERGIKRDFVIGPSIGFDIPLFNTGSIQRDRVRFAQLKAKKQEEAEKRIIVARVEKVHASRDRLLEAIEEYEGQIVPRAAQMVELLEIDNKNMQRNSLEVMEKQAQLLDLQTELLTEKRRLFKVEAEIERLSNLFLVTGKRLE